MTESTHFIYYFEEHNLSISFRIVLWIQNTLEPIKYMYTYLD